MKKLVSMYTVLFSSLIETLVAEKYIWLILATYWLKIGALVKYCHEVLLNIGALVRYCHELLLNIAVFIFCHY